MKISVVGLGYVGLQMAVKLSKYYHVVGFDINRQKINNYKKNIDLTGEVNEQLKCCNVEFSFDEKSLCNSDIFIICVPTPSEEGEIDMSFVKNACLEVGRYLKNGSIVILESTYYIGGTKNFCVPLLEESGLIYNKDFFVAFSPERVNPGDKKNCFENMTKVVGCENLCVAQKIDKIYSKIFKNCYVVNSFEVAEATKLLENLQRDVNIGLINEYSLLLNILNVNIYDVLNAASTKWNFQYYTPGLVGGHCIGVDTNYVLKNASDLKIKMPISSSARQINEYMPQMIASKIINYKFNNIENLKLLVLGLTYKPNVPDFRNSKIFKTIDILKKNGVECILNDPYDDYGYVKKEYNKQIGPLCEVDAILLAVKHDEYLKNLDKYVKYIKREEKVIFTLFPIPDIEGVKICNLF